MRTFAAALVAAALLASCDRAPPSTQDVAPAFDVPRLDGDGRLRLSDYRGRVVYLDFWASWCGPCRISLPEIERLCESLRDRPDTDSIGCGPDVAILGVTLDRDPAKARAFLDAFAPGLPAAIDSDGAVSRLYGVRGLPAGMLIDRTGRIRFRYAGYLPVEQIAVLKAHIALLRAER